MLFVKPNFISICIGLAESDKTLFSIECPTICSLLILKRFHSRFMVNAVVNSIPIDVISQKYDGRSFRLLSN